MWSETQCLFANFCVSVMFGILPECVINGTNHGRAFVSFRSLSLSFFLSLFIVCWLAR